MASNSRNPEYERWGSKADTCGFPDYVPSISHLVNSGSRDLPHISEIAEVGGATGDMGGEIWVVTMVLHGAGYRHLWKWASTDEGICGHSRNERHCLLPGTPPEPGGGIPGKRTPARHHRLTAWPPAEHRQNESAAPCAPCRSAQTTCTNNTAAAAPHEPAWNGRRPFDQRQPALVLTVAGSAVALRIGLVVAARAGIAGTRAFPALAALGGITGVL